MVGLLSGIGVGLSLLGLANAFLAIEVSLVALAVGWLIHELGHIVAGWWRHSHKIRGGPYFSLGLFALTLLLHLIPDYILPRDISSVAAANFLVHAFADEGVLYKDLLNVIFKKPRLSLESLHPSIRAWVKEEAKLAEARRIEVVDSSDDSRLLREAVAAGELIALPDGNYYARTHPKDTARAEERTFVATRNEQHKGKYNNWRRTNDIKPQITDKTNVAIQAKTK